MPDFEMLQISIGRPVDMAGNIIIENVGVPPTLRVPVTEASLYAPGDFDISPYFEIIKPTIVAGFDYRKLHWADRAKPPREVAASSPFRKKRKRFGLKSDAQDSALHSGAADNEAHAEPSPAHALPAKAVRAKVKNTKADHQTASRKMAGNKRARNINADKSYPENASA